jgi:hypothetical protein
VAVLIGAPFRREPRGSGPGVRAVSVRRCIVTDIPMTTFL